MDARGVIERRADHGFVMVCVLWVLAILTVIVIGFGRRAILDARGAAFSLDHTQAMFMARGGVELGVAELRNKVIIDFINRQGGRTSRAQRWAKTVDMLKEGNYFTSVQGEDFEKDICEYRIRDEEGLITINAAPEKILDEIEGLSFSVRRKILRRRTGDRDEGVPPQPFQATEELLYMQGIDEDEWYGTERQAGLRDILTCWGDGKINVNTAPRAVLECIPDLDDGDIDMIVGYRAGSDGELGTGDDKDFKAIDEVRDELGIEGDSLQALRQYCKVRSRFFTITGVATRRQGKVRAVCRATVQTWAARAAVIKWREEFLES